MLLKHNSFGQYFNGRMTGVYTLNNRSQDDGSTPSCPLRLIAIINAGIGWLVSRQTC